MSGYRQHVARHPVSVLHVTIARVLQEERKRPRPGWSDGYTVAAVNRRRVAGASSIDRLETGTQMRVNPAMTTSLMFNCYESPTELIKRVTELAEATMESDWWAAYRPAPEAALWLWRYHLEQAAHVTVHNSVYIPQAARCPEYDAVMSAVEGERLDGRMKPLRDSAGALLESRAASAQRLTCLIGEAALRVDVGAEAGAAQRRHLAALDSLANTEVFIVPLDAGPYGLLGSEWGMLQFGDGVRLMVLTGPTVTYLDPDSERAKGLRRASHDALARAVPAREYCGADTDDLGPKPLWPLGADTDRS